MFFALTIITSLVCYIVFLHIVLYKRNSTITLLLKQIEKHTDNFKSRLTKNDPHSKHFLTDKVFKDFIFSNERGSLILIHYTSTENIAKQIMSDGFMFENILYKTTEEITNNDVELLYKHNIRKSYGHYIMILSISKRIIDKYQKELSKYPQYTKVEQMIAKPFKVKDDDALEFFVLPPEYVKGYINFEEGTIERNKKYHSEYDPMLT